MAVRHELKAIHGGPDPAGKFLPKLGAFAMMTFRPISALPESRAAFGSSAVAPRAPIAGAQVAEITERGKQLMAVVFPPPFAGRSVGQLRCRSSISLNGLNQ